MWVLGVNCPPAGWHDPAACLVDGDGTVVAFSEEERFIRRRHAIECPPAQAAAYCLDVAGIEPEDVDVVALGWDIPALHPGRFPDDAALLRHALGADWEWAGAEIVPVRHHLAHARCAFHASGHEAAAVLVVDGTGEQEATTIWSCRAGEPPSLRRTWSTGKSLGCAYDAASEWLGFSMHQAGKTMGLAAYGRAAEIDVPSLVRFQDGDFVLHVGDPEPGVPRNQVEVANQYNRMVSGWTRAFADIAGARKPREPAERLQLDPAAVRVARSAQALIEDVLPWLAREARSLTGIAELCLAGGVALNCAANGRLEPPVYVPPVPHDAGVALGAAWHVSPPRGAGAPLSPYLGAAPGPAPHLDGAAPFDPDRVAQLLLDGRIGALVEGRAEIGPRALCHRSILAAPRPRSLAARLNGVKHREPWRPFGPVAPPSMAGVLWEHQPALHRYMLGAAEVTPEGDGAAPAVVHVDGTTRPQIVD
ncbi:MAG: carbamoyltransferase N-terminal domain-containing protein, partial [Solirubrobacteraceae bacterium]